MKCLITDNLKVGSVHIFFKGEKTCQCGDKTRMLSNENQNRASQTAEKLARKASDNLEWFSTNETILRRIRNHDLSDTQRNVFRNSSLGKAGGFCPHDPKVL